MVSPINKIETAYRELTGQGHEILRLFSGNPNDEGFVFPPEILEDAYRRYFRNQGYHPYPKGLRTAREAVSHYYEAHGAAVDPDHVLLTAGTSESFFYLFSLLTKPGDNILAPNPSYPLFDPIAQMAGIALRPYALREDQNWMIDFEEIRELTNVKTRAIVLISPNNPTGAVAHADEVGDVVHWANLRNIPVICDEVFSEFVFETRETGETGGPGKFPRPMTARPKLCFTLNGISKMFALPALKLGWIAVTGDKALVEPAVDRLETTADTFLSCHTPIQEALPEIFEKGKDFVASYVAEVGRRRRLAMDLLGASPHLKVIEPIGGFYLMAEVTKETRLTEEDFVIELMRKTGVFIHPGYFFDYEKGIHVVLSFLVHPNRLERGIRALVRFVGGR